MKKTKPIYRFESSVAQTIDRYALLRQGDRVLIGLSGGADSVSLLFSLRALSTAYGVTVAACHVNHHIRACSAERDEEFCRKLCERLGIAFFSRQLDVPKLCREKKGSTEEIARNARYACFDELCAAHGFTKIATAHTLSDNAETVLFNLIKGCSPDGLSGIPFCRDSIIRPLRERTRDEVEAYLSALGESFVTDETNLSVEYDRNYIRHTILPAAKRLNPALEQALGRMSDAATEDKHYFEERLAAIDRPNASTTLTDSTANVPQDTLSVDLLTSLPVPLAKRYLLSRCRAHVQERLTQKHIDALYRLIRQERDNAYVDLPSCRAAICNGQVLFLPRDVKDMSKSTLTQTKDDFNISLRMGYTVINSHFLIRVAYSDKCSFGKDAGAEKTDFPNVFKFENNVYKLYEKIDCRCDIIVESLYVRSRKAEDRLAIGGMHRLLKKVYSERRVPLELRGQIPVVCDENGVLCVPFFRVPREDAAPKPNDERALSIAFYTAVDSQFCKE